MADLQRLDFEEIDRMWTIAEHYSDGTSRPGEAFMASGHERYTKLAQILDRLKSEYPSYRSTRTPYNKVNEKHYRLEVAPVRAD
jgi:hypothetical protein